MNKASVSAGYGRSIQLSGSWTRMGGGLFAYLQSGGGGQKPGTFVVLPPPSHTIGHRPFEKFFHHGGH